MNFAELTLIHQLLKREVERLTSLLDECLAKERAFDYETQEYEDAVQESRRVSKLKSLACNTLADFENLNFFK